MLPAVGNDVLSANPNFEALYRDLCVNKLNANATTKVDPKVQKERNAFDEVSADVASKKTDDVDYHVVHDEGGAQKKLTRRQELRAARSEATKRAIIKSYLDSLSYRSDQLPAEVCHAGWTVLMLERNLTKVHSSRSSWPLSPQLCSHRCPKKMLGC